MFSLAGKRVFVAGHRGMVGRALVRKLAAHDCEILVAPREELDLRDQAGVARFFADRRPQVVLMAAAKVGGIHANDSLPADFIYDNLVMATNVLGAALRNEVEKLTFLGSSCIYPRLAPQPLREDALLTGPLEPTNEWYAIAKIAGVKMCQAFRRQHGADFISAMPTNLYGPHDNFDLDSSHVLPALIAKAHRAKTQGAKTLPVWGSGAPRREFMHVDDCADAILFLTQRYSGEAHVNVGSGEEVTIRDLAHHVARVVGLQAELTFDASKPDGTPRKLMDSSRLRDMGWSARIALEDGLRATYAWYLAEAAER
ncbi:MAG: GDP-L-fucose synthase [Beijerinckiaceae bacterium]